MAYHLANAEQKEYLKEVFGGIAGRILATGFDLNSRKAFGRSLMGVSDVLGIREAVAPLIGEMDAAETNDQLFELIWPIVVVYVRSKVVQNMNNGIVRLQLAKMWMAVTTPPDLVGSAHGFGDDIGRDHEEGRGRVIIFAKVDEAEVDARKRLLVLRAHIRRSRRLRRHRDLLDYFTIKSNETLMRCALGSQAAPE